MKIQNSNIAFKRALTIKEKREYKDCINQAKKELNHKDTIVILFDYLMPVEKDKNLGIGTTFSDNSQRFVNFIKDYCGINAIQLGPQGILKDNTASPYSATSLSIGEHIIDLFKLSRKEYENILPKSQIEPFLINENPDTSYKVNYKKLVRQDFGKERQDFVFSKLLDKAFYNFNKLSEKSKLKREYNKFYKENKYRLDKESLYYAISEKYGSTQWQNWEEYKSLFMSPDASKTKSTEKLLNKILKPQIDYFNFVQFIADKQQKEVKKAFNKNGIKLFGDIPISFSPSEQWANKPLFTKDYCYGYKENGEYYGWGSPAPDIDDLPKNEEKIKNLFKQRLYANLKRYDGIRIDAAWEMFNPCLVKWTPEKSYGKMLMTLGTQLFDTIEEVGEKVHKRSFSPDNIYLELLGKDEELHKPVAATKNKYPHLLLTSVYDAVRHYTDDYGYIDGKFAIGVGTHDHRPLLGVSERLKNKEDKQIQDDAKRLRKNMKIDENLADNPSLYRILKLAEIFTVKKQYMNIFDILGTNQAINIWGEASKEFWTDRIPINYEKMYFKNLTEGKGLNLPEALLYAIKAKSLSLSDNQQKLINKLKNFSEILKEEGPLTEEEANKVIK